MPPDPELPSQPATVRPGFGEAVLLLLAMFAFSAVAMMAIVVGRRSAEIDVVLMGAVELLSLALVLLIGLRMVRVTPRQVFLLRGTRAGMLLAPLPLAAALVVIITTIEAPILRAFPIPESFAEVLSELLLPAGPGGWARVIAVAVILIPLGEELLFRGLFLRGFYYRYGATPALALSAALFALVHLNPWGVVGIFIAGWVLGWLVLRSGSLWPAVMLHGAYNLASVLQLSAEGEGGSTLAALAAAPWRSPPLLAGSAAVLVWLVLYFRRRGRRRAPWDLERSGAAAPEPEQDHN
jgi:membrane protease YdiL (CAAX protease family)